MRRGPKDRKGQDRNVKVNYIIIYTIKENQRNRELRKINSPNFVDTFCLYTITVIFILKSNYYFNYP